MKKIASKKCGVCLMEFSPRENYGSKAWLKRLFCSSKCSNSRKNNGQYSVGHSAKENSGSFKRGSRPWNMGMVGFMADEKHWLWKGGDVGYGALHLWVIRRLGRPSSCSQCNKSGLSGSQIHWANKSGRYMRSLNDWIRLCASCHRKYDIENGYLKSKHNPKYAVK